MNAERIISNSLVSCFLSSCQSITMRSCVDASLGCSLGAQHPSSRCAGCCTGCGSAFRVTEHGPCTQNVWVAVCGKNLLYDMEYYSAIKKNSFESVLMRWMKLEPIIQSEVSQKEKHQIGRAHV